MKIIYLFFALISFQLVSSKFIKNLDINSCKNCVYYKPGYITSTSKCEYFGKKNIIDNIIENDYAEKCREDESKCGLEGKYFKENKFADIQIFTRNISSGNLLILSLIFGYIGYLLKLDEQIK